MNADAAVVLDKLRVAIRGREILGIESLRVAPDEVLGVLGPNGAGKSTLLRVLGGFQKPYQGSARVLGSEVNCLSHAQMACFRRQVGYVPQLPAIGGELPLTIREVVAIGRTGARGLFRGLRREDWHLVDCWIDRLGLADVAGAAYTETSGGQQRRAILARVMVQEPRLLLLDEPTAHLDLGAREQIVQIVDQLHRESRLPAILVCHEVEVLPPACARVVILDDGAIQAMGPAEQVLTADGIRAMYGPGFRVLHNAGRHAVLPIAEGWT